MKAQYEAWMDGALAQGTLYTQPHCTVLRQFKQGTPLVPHYFKQNTVGCPPQPKELSAEAAHVAKGRQSTPIPNPTPV